MALKDKRLFLLDMDGTIYLDDQLFDGTLDFLSFVKDRGGRCVYLTNNSSRGKDAYVEKLTRLGIDSCRDDFVSSADVTLSYLKEKYKDALYYVCGTESLKGDLRAAGLRISEEAADDVDVLLLGYDTELNYKKLEDCCILLNRGCDYVATHPDLVCPVWYGFAPDCGSVIHMLKTATGREPLVMGKPKPEMALYAMRRFGFNPSETCLVGDRLYTDIACGINAGIDTVFVLSGEGRTEDIDRYGIRPDYIFPGIRDILNEIEKETRHEA